jgi:hypothetical protein
MKVTIHIALSNHCHRISLVNKLVSFIGLNRTSQVHAVKKSSCTQQDAEKRLVSKRISGKVYTTTLISWRLVCQKMFLCECIDVI